METYTRIRLGVLLCCLLPLSVQAALPEWLESFPRSRQIQEEVQAAPDYRVMLGRVLKINGLIRSDRELRLSGELQRTTWQLPVGQGPEEGYRFIRDQLQRAGADILFECSGRQCGASNIWANDLFETARLYGVDESQFYLAARRADSYLMVYTIRRGNGRVFLNVDWVRDSSSGAGGDDWQARLLQQGYAVLPEWPESPDRTVQRILGVLEQDPASRVLLVMHQADRDVELSIRQTRELAKRLRDLVIAEGVAPSRVEAHGVGALVPSVLGDRDQLGVLILNREE
ncbi:DUF4892 domain-containing protein [Marinobacterium litorale]|jgi:hypothetical protein|uniref:DUF4892 domain-containing protein n=1 Tax=Marinobacterium litorale TaxID=404770 RepID=UPI000409AE3D|nr:DUF4892 domain-containing protein [Marinobacterium litorale]